MSDVIRWEDPPAQHGNARPRLAKYQPMADALRARPGQWAVVSEGRLPGSAGSLASQIRNGVGPFAPAKHFQAKTIGPAGGPKAMVYARYVGEVTTTDA